LAGICVAVSMIALVVSLAAIITIKTRLGEITAAGSGATVRNWDSYLAGHFTVWSVAFLSQACLYCVVLFYTPRNLAIRSIPYPATRDSVMSEVRHSDQDNNLYMLEATQPSSPLAGLPSPTFSARSSPSLKSWRGSLQQVVRPVTSRTKLLNRPPLTRDTQSLYSDANSIDTVSQSDGFEAWDTSSVSIPPKDAVPPFAPSRGTALEPIPGSRPASPARALDGPFLLDPETSPVLPLSPPPKLLPDTSRPPSPAVSEAHIHPLFRTESPVPPPEVLTPGTNVLASPLSTQMIPCPAKSYSRMRSSSRVGSPSISSQNFHSGSVTPQRTSRSPSPPSRELTPPIPDFVLNSSPRSSGILKNFKQKTPLQLRSSP
jgi:hypothetical protein